MTSVERLRVDAVQMPHAPRKRGIDGLDKQVKVVAHQAVGMTEPAEAADSLGENIEKRRAISIIK